MALDLTVFTPSWLRAFGESITYVKADATTRTITAVVHRQPASPIPEAPDALRPYTIVHVANDATAADPATDAMGGISADELDTGGDTLQFGRRVGGAAETFTIVRIASQDEGMLALECR